MHRSIRIGFDATWQQRSQKSGIGFYTEYLLDTLATTYPDEVQLIGYYYRKWGAPPMATYLPNVSYRAHSIILLKIINVLRRFHIEIPAELLLGHRVDFLLNTAYISQPSWFKTPSAVAIHDLAYLDVPDSVSRRNRLDLVRNVPKSLQRANFVLTISEWTKQRILSSYSVKKPIVITPIPPQPIVTEKPVNLTDRFGITGRFLLVFGTIEPRKNIYNILLAYSQLPDDLRITYSLVLAGGKGWNDAAILEKITELREQGLTIHTTGYVSTIEKNSLFRKASAFVMCSLYEGFGMPLLEAMLYDLPVVTSDLAVFHEVCGKAAVYCDPQDPQAITNGLQGLLTSQSLQSKLVAAGKHNLDRFSWGQNAALLYEQIVKSLNE